MTIMVSGHEYSIFFSVCGKAAVYQPQHRSIGFLLLFVFLIFFAGCKDSSDRPVNVIGSTSIQPFAELLAEEFLKINPDETIDVQGGGSTAGIQAIANEIADIGMCSRTLKEEENSVDTAIEIARDGLAVVVHKSNPVNDLTIEQIQMLFSGQIQNWKSLGGNDMPVRLIMREEGSGTREAFIKLVMDKKIVSRKALVQESNGAVKELVRLDPAAVGYMSLGLVGEELKSLHVNGVEPLAEQVKSGKYKLSRPFLFVLKTNSQLRPQAQEFIDFVLSDLGQKILESEGLIRVK
ncbi:MAG: phosphate ABC transporter substrate-binding protein [Sedimentisphaerales bacterium]|nr:phosphate ABC transporter substrate-binding protein [Sedimentisphaerales bacterium]